jgi:hypothetical protein
MKKTNFFKVSIVAGLAVLAVSCTSDNGVGTSTSLSNTSSDNAQASSISEEIVNTSETFLGSADTKPLTVIGTGASKVAALADSVKADTAGVNIGISSKGYPKTITMTFHNYLGKRGNILNGTITAVISANMKTQGATRTIKFKNFTVNGNNVAGTKTVTTVTPLLSWSVVSNDTITTLTGGKLICSLNHIRTFIPANGTSPAMLSISGSSSGVSAAGKTYTVTINSPLIYYFDYRHIVKGNETITSEKKSETIDFGDGTKDDKATVTFDGKVYDITLK